MLIPENLRQEHMPMMVYAICNIAKKGMYSEEELIKQLTLSIDFSDESCGLARKVLLFCKDANFVEIDKGIVISNFTDAELETPADFSVALLKKIDFEKSEKFSAMLKWFLWKGLSVEALEYHKDVRNEMLEDTYLKQLNISEDTTHGFLFWVEFLGIATHTWQKMGCYNYSIDDILLKYIEKNRAELIKYGSMPTLEFLNILSKDIGFIPYCYANTEICCSLSLAFRILDRLGKIEIIDKNDGSMTWHLEKSYTFKVGNSFTNIKVM